MIIFLFVALGDSITAKNESGPGEDNKMDILDVYVLFVFAAFFISGVIVTLSKSFRAEIRVNRSNEED